MRRKPSLTREEFAQYHREKHAPLFSSLPAVRQYVRRYVQCHTIEASLPGMPPVTFDGITEIWFDDVAGLKAVFGSESYLQQIRPDEEKFIDLHSCEFVLSTENVVISGVDV